MTEAAYLTPDRVDITPLLSDRPARTPDYEAQKRAVSELMRLANERPHELLGRLVSLTRELCQAESAGISLYEPDGKTAGVFRWHHLSGVLATFTGATTPRNFSPCGICLDRGHTILMHHPERAYSWIREANIAVPEVLLVPLRLGVDAHIGTLWVVAPEGKTFDAEDSRILSELAGLTSIAAELSRLSAGLTESA